ncbi:MAG: ATP-binding protein [Fimbriimonadaceae bacterium]|nr:ATP-binding protein [Fimbriimonadaceae bacterium]
MYARHVEARLTAALADTPVVVLHGARQTGKSTLAQALAAGRGGRYASLDNLARLAAAESDPRGFLAELGTPAVIDEVQLAPVLFRAIKERVDADRQPGQYLLTGSADLLRVPELASALVGRLEVVTLWPLAEGEIRGVTANGVDRLWNAELPAAPPLSRTDALQLALRGGFPEAVARASQTRRSRWFEAYLDTVIRRDLPRGGDFLAAQDAWRLVQLLATRAGQLLQWSELGRGVGLDRRVVQRQAALLEQAFVAIPLPAWASNLSKRLSRTPKLLLGDTGLLGYLLALTAPPALDLVAGQLLENFVGLELLKALAWSEQSAALCHYRTHDGSEVDFLLERRDGTVLAIAVKTGATFGAREFGPLQGLRERLGDRLVAGYLLGTGDTTTSFGDRLYTAPISLLWAE